MELYEVQGPRGLTLAIPKGYASAPDGERVRVYHPQRERSRSPVEISVAVLDHKPSRPATKQREVGGRDVHYAMDESEGGSGGPALRFTAWVEIKGRFVTLESVAQPDSGGDAEFRAEWAILAGLR